LENNPAPNPNPNPEPPVRTPDQPAAPAQAKTPVEVSQPTPEQPETSPQAPPTQAKPQLSISQQAQPQPADNEPSLEAIEAEARRKHNLVMLEAALYVAGRPLEINELCSVLTTRSKKKAEQLLEALAAEYAARNTSMEILKLKDDRYVMQVKAEFTPLVKRLVNRPLLSSGPLKTLSYIAYRQPITSKRVIEVRGQHAYGHVKMLKEMGLVATERAGRSLMLRTTDYFADYFGLMQDPALLKRELKRIFGDAFEAFKDEPQPQQES
jgi:segregation and condensation protein B